LKDKQCNYRPADCSTIHRVNQTVSSLTRYNRSVPTYTLDVTLTASTTSTSGLPWLWTVASYKDQQGWVPTSM